MVLAFITSDRDLVSATTVPVNVNRTTRSVSLAVPDRADRTTAPGTWIVLLVALDLDALPTRPFVVRDDQGDTVVPLGDLD